MNIDEILCQRGYKIICEYNHSYSSCKSGIYEIKKGDNYFFSKPFFERRNESMKWDEIKGLLIKLAGIGLTPDIKEFIDITDKSGLIISHSFGEPFSSFLQNKQKTKIKNEIRKKIELKLSSLHNMGYLHGDMHADNILIHDDEIKFIDFDECYHKDDPRCEAHFKTKYADKDFISATKRELLDIDFVV